MTGLKLLGAAAILSSALSVSAAAQEAVQEPASLGQAPSKRGQRFLSVRRKKAQPAASAEPAELRDVSLGDNQRHARHPWPKLHSAILRSILDRSTRRHTGCCVLCWNWTVRWSGASIPISACSIAAPKN